MAQSKQENTAVPATLNIQGDDVKLSLSKMKMSEKLDFLRKVSEYVGAETVDTNKYLNVPVKVTGVLIHTATINRGSIQKLDEMTGEMIEEPIYAEANRTVFKLADGGVLGFVAVSIENYVRDYIVPAFGMGDWIDDEGQPLTVTLKISQVTSKGGRAYAIQVV